MLALQTSVVRDYAWMYANEFCIILPWMLLFYFSYTGILYLILYTVNIVGTRIQPAKAHSQELFVLEVKWSTSTLVVGCFFVTILRVAYMTGNAALYDNIEDYGWAWWAFSTFMMWAFNDFYMYWQHRFLHSKQGLSWHRIHHIFKAPTPFSTMAFHPVEACIMFGVLPLAVFFPVHLPSLIVFFILLFTISVLEHCGHLIPGMERLSPIIATPKHHDIHHEKVVYNFGLYSSVWDVVCKTNAPPSSSTTNLSSAKCPQ